MKTVYFSESIEACYVKVGRYRQINDLAQGRVRTKIKARYSQKLLSHSEPNFV